MPQHGAPQVTQTEAVKGSGPPFGGPLIGVIIFLTRLNSRLGAAKDQIL